MIRRVGRPSLLGTMARTAGAPGAVNRSVNRAANRPAPPQADPYREAQAPPAPPPAAEPRDAADEVIAKLDRLAELHASGVLTEAEFAAAKARLLG